MKKHVLGRLLAALLSVAMVVSLLNFANLVSRAQAATDTWTKTVAGLSTSVIKAPAAPADVSTPWTGSYVWYGKYDGTPVKYRVLNPKCSLFSNAEKPTLFLDCDSVLYEALFAEEETSDETPGFWAESDVKAGVNGGEFLTKAKGFSAIERNAIIGSKVASHGLVAGNTAGCVSAEWKEVFGDYIALTGEKIFFLDCEEASNPTYGYRSSTESTSRAKLFFGEDYYGYWWLRSNMTEEYGTYYQYAGTIHTQPAGMLDYSYKGSPNGVSPAFNVNLSSIIFSSVVKGTAGKDNAEYKLTLADSNLTVGIQSGKTVTASGSKITVPYTITGSDASKATQVSVLILDKTYTAGNTNSAKIKYYGKLTTSGTFATTGTGTFTLPSGLSLSGWNSSYYVYLLAEDVNSIHETDYASIPQKLAAPASTLKITTQPGNKSLLVGSKAKFTVVATGTGTLQYQWQFRKNSSSAWADSAQSGNKTNTLLVTTTAGMHGYQFRCVVSDSTGGKAYSNAATLTLKPRITTQPVDKSLLVGSTAKFTVAATGKATLKYQWQYRKNSSSEWADSGQQGAKTDTLLVSTTAALHGYQFRCVVTDGNGQKSYTRAATLSLKPRITTQPVNKDLLVGSTAKFTIAATGKGTLKYQWQYRKNESAEWADSGQQGAKTDTLLVSTTAAIHGYQFRCIVTDGNGQKSYSKTVTLTLKPRITTQPTDKSVTAGNKAKFTVAATGKATLTYQWQYRKNSSSAWADSGQSGNKTATLSVATTKALNGYQFRCIVTDGNGRKSYSSIVTLTVK